MRAQRRDANEPAIVEALELAGYAVARHYAPDPFDLLVRRLGSPVGLCIEVKMPSGDLTENQRAMLEDHGIVVVRTVDEALDAAARWL